MTPTPEEKAQDLHDKFFITVVGEDSFEGIKLANQVAKECCLICCDEVIKQDMVWANSMNVKLTVGFYWQAVKKEIELL